MAQNAGQTVGRGAAFSRGAFLASSWTWCIGMYLPVILVRDLGWVGWVVFAVPNVVGAMSMGLVLRAPGAGDAWLEGRLGAARWFSRITIAFHGFFLAWAWTLAFGRAQAAPAAAFAVAVIAAGLALGRLRSGRLWSAAGVAAWVFSAGCLGLLAWIALPEAALPMPTTPRQAVDALFLAGVCVFGFSLCPYLDLTFHRVRRETPGRAGSAAFVVGFGGLFLAMIVGTLVYAGRIGLDALAPIVLAHIAVQSAFTVGAHARELHESGVPGAVGVPGVPGVPGVRGGGEHEASRVWRRVWNGGGVAAAAGLCVGGAMVWADRARLPIVPEDVYSVFMGFYGLVFPGWVWIAGRTGDASWRRRRRVWLAATAAALPAFFMGFVAREWWWLGPGLGVVLLARFFAEKPGVLRR